MAQSSPARFRNHVCGGVHYVHLYRSEARSSRGGPRGSDCPIVSGIFSWPMAFWARLKNDRTGLQALPSNVHAASDNIPNSRRDIAQSCPAYPACPASKRQVSAAHAGLAASDIVGLPKFFLLARKHPVSDGRESPPCASPCLCWPAATTPFCAVICVVSVRDLSMYVLEAAEKLPLSSPRRLDLSCLSNRLGRFSPLRASVSQPRSRAAAGSCTPTWALPLRCRCWLGRYIG
jgi:hypothetical protein